MSQAAPTSTSGRTSFALWSKLLIAVVICGVGGIFYPQWGPPALAWWRKTVKPVVAQGKAARVAAGDHDEHDGHDHTGHDHAGHDHSAHKDDHDHDHPGHSEADSLEMSEQARKNIGLKVAKVELTRFTKTVSVPAMIAERPGRSTVLVTAPMTGIITRIHAIDGDAVEPGRKLFDLRLTHEELVQSQVELLQTVEQLEVTSREIKRIGQLTENGGLAGKQLLERQYDKQKLDAVLRSKREALLLHGLTAEQIEAIVERRELLKELSVVAPAWADEARPTDRATPYQVQSLNVSPGQHVNAGDTLVTLVDHAELYVQGEAFERDVPLVQRAADSGAPLTASLESEEGRSETITGLQILYLATKVDPGTRTLDFFVTLPNEVQRDATLSDGRRYFAWKFRPGQRVQLQVPVATWEQRLVLPVEAVAQDGVESYVFAPNGDHFDRRAVHVEYRESQWVVIANDGSLAPGELVAISSAQQLQLALKNKSGGAIDPHAGHNH